MPLLEKVIVATRTRAGIGHAIASTRAGTGLSLLSKHIARDRLRAFRELTSRYWNEAGPAASGFYKE